MSRLDCNVVVVVVSKKEQKNMRGESQFLE